MKLWICFSNHTLQQKRERAYLHTGNFVSPFGPNVLEQKSSIICGANRNDQYWVCFSFALNSTSTWYVLDHCASKWRKYMVYSSGLVFYLCSQSRSRFSSGVLLRIWKERSQRSPKLVAQCLFNLCACNKNLKKNPKMSNWCLVNYLPGLLPGTLVPSGNRLAKEIEVNHVGTV